MSAPFRLGPRVSLRPVELSDAPLLQRWINDPEVTQFLMASRPYSLHAEEEWIRDLGKDRNDVVLVISLREDERAIGNVGLHGIDPVARKATLGILIGEKECWSKGYGTEALRLMLAYAFDSLGLHRVELHVYDYNPRAVRSYEKAGFRREGLLREARFWQGTWHDVIMMGILAHEFRALEHEARAFGLEACVGPVPCGAGPMCR